MLARAAAGVLLALPLAAGAPAQAQSPANAPRLSDSTPRHGQVVQVSGRVGRQYAGRSVVLEYAEGAGAWRPLRQARVGADGRYSFRVALTRSGSVRTVVGAAAGQAVAAQAATASAPTRVAVAGALGVTRQRLDVMPRGTAIVSGHLRPAQPGRTVRLQRRAGGGWRTLASDRTGPDGRFFLRFRAGRAGGYAVRLAFAGDGANAAATRGLGRLGVYRAGTASFYTLYGGALACGGRLGYHSLVVAHRSLPCGTPVTVRYRGRSVRARVMDRGPFIGGREWDLAGAVARRLGFSGVQRVWVAVGR
jgi:hypothetical protein